MYLGRYSLSILESAPQRMPGNAASGEKASMAHWRCLLCLAAIFLSALRCEAEELPTDLKYFDVASQSLPRALGELCRQAGLRKTFPETVANSRVRVRAVRGRMTVKEAL